MAVALYARVSTVKQAEKDLSIPDQLQQIRDWCKANGYVVAMEYVEAGASATDDRRPVFQQMIADAKRRMRQKRKTGQSKGVTHHMKSQAVALFAI